MTLLQVQLPVLTSRSPWDVDADEQMLAGYQGLRPILVRAPPVVRCWVWGQVSHSETAAPWPFPLAPGEGASLGASDHAPRVPLLGPTLQGRLPESA